MSFFVSYSNEVLLIARVIVGVVMVYYGLPKVRDLKGNARDFVKMGFRPGWLWGTIVAAVEFLGGILFILGLFVPIIAVLFGFEMLMGALWKITRTKKPFTDWSYDLLLLALMLLFAMIGGGFYSLMFI